MPTASTDVATRTELHTHLIDADGVARMRQVQAVDVPADGSVSLQPGGLHIMLIDLKQPLRADQSFPLTLRFEKAGVTQVSVPIWKREAMMETMQHQGHDHSGHARP